MTEQLERQFIEIVAMDRIDRPISSMSGKLKRQKPKLAKAKVTETIKWVNVPLKHYVLQGSNELKEVTPKHKR